MTKKTKQTKPLISADEVIAKVGDYCIADSYVGIIRKRIAKPDSWEIVPYSKKNTVASYEQFDYIDNLTAGVLFDKIGFFMIITKKDADEIVNAPNPIAEINKIKAECTFKHKVVGRNVKKIGDFFVFGCGSVVLTEKEIKEIYRVKSNSMYGELMEYINSNASLDDITFKEVELAMKILGIK